MRAVDPILPTEPDVHLLTSISALPESYRADAFSHGLNFTSGVECAVPTTWPMCQTDPDAEKTTDSFGDDVGFKQFMAVYALECPDGYTHAGSEARNASMVRSIFDVIKHQIVAGQLWWNQAEPTVINSNGVRVNPSLKTSAVVLGSPSTVGDPISVIARLFEARRKLSGSGTVLIHGPLVLVPYLVSQRLIKKVGGRYEGDGWTYVTDEGYPSDGGTTGGGTGGPLVDPTDLNGGYEADEGGAAWMYASGAIEYAWGPYVGKNTLGASTPDGGGAPTDNDGRYSEITSWDGRTNRTYIQVEQTAFLRFDPCHILAAKAYIPTITQGEGV